MTMLSSSPSNRHYDLQIANTQPVPYQRPPNGIEATRIQQGFWRTLELQLKRELNTLPVTVVFHPQELIILDKGTNDAVVWRAIKKLQQKRRFSVVVESETAPNLGHDALGFLWMQNHPQEAIQRRWIIRSVGT